MVVSLNRTLNAALRCVLVPPVTLQKLENVDIDKLSHTAAQGYLREAREFAGIARAVLLPKDQSADVEVEDTTAIEDSIYGDS